MLLRLLPLLALPLFAQSDWDEPFPPHRIADNLYYVGSKGLSTYLVTSTKGHILINASFERTVPIIRANVEKLGFKLSDVKILLSSHAHDDHVGGLALLKELTGAEVYVMAGDDKVISSGGKGQYLYKAEWKPCKVDKILKDGDIVELGEAKLRAHLTPGHTRGNTTWTLQVNDQGKSLNAVIIGSPNVNPGFQLVNNKEYPEMAADYARTFRVLKSLECDLFLGAHGLYYGMVEKHKRMKPGSPNPFIDPASYREYVADREQFYLYTLEQQQKLVAQTDLPTAEWVLQFGGRVRLPNSANWINDPSQLPKTGFRLEAVDLVGTIIDHKDLSKLSVCTELRELLLPGTIFNPGAGSTLDANDELKALATLTKLDKLGFSLHFLTNVNVSDKGLKQFANLKQLRELRFSMTRVKGEGLAPFVNTEKLDLSYTPVTDAGLTSVAGMSKLRQLGLRDTFVTDDGLAHLAQLKTLESLDLYGLKLTDRGAAHLRGLTNLHTLNLLGAQLSDDSMEVLARMTQLTELNLYRSQITNAGLAKLKTLKNLSTLDLRYTRVTRNGVEDFRAAVPGVQIAFQESAPVSTDSTLRTSAPTAKTPAAMATWIERLGGRSSTEAGQIRSIDLSRTSVTEAQLAHLAALPVLERLRLNTTEIGDGGTANIAKLTALRDLDLGHTMVSDNGLAPLAALKHLQRLTLNHTLVKGSGLHNVPTVEDLDVANAPINDAGAAQIATLANLQSLRLAYTDISNAGVQALAPLKKLRRLDLLSTDISDDTMKALAGFTNLEALNISYNKIGAKGLAHLATLTSLTQLEAARTRIDDEAVPHLARFTAIKQLNLDYTALSDKGLALLQPALPNLELLRLDTANLTDAAIDTLAKFPKLRDLNIYHTLITEAANNKLKQLKPDTRIVFDPASALPTRRKS